MKNLIALLIVGLLIFGGVYDLAIKASEDPGESFAMAFGNAEGDTIEMHAVIYGLTVRKDPPRVDLKTGALYWEEWVRNHFHLTDSAGRPVPLKRDMGSAMIPSQDLKTGTPEFFLVAALKKGTKYTFDYMPRVGGPERYRHEFTSPSQAEKLRRPLFKPKPP